MHAIDPELENDHMQWNNFKNAFSFRLIYNVAQKSI